jgi:hypothetical protein
MHRRAKLPSREKGVSLGSARPRRVWGITESRADTAALGSCYPHFPRQPLPSREAENDGSGGGRGRPHAVSADRMVGVAARYASCGESEGARAGGRSLCVRSPRPIGVSGRCLRAWGAWDGTGLGCDDAYVCPDRSAGAPGLAGKLERHVPCSGQRAPCLE